MDITPQLLKDIQLSDSRKGYNKDEVDDLLERVGTAIVQLQGRLRDALDRANAAEALAAVSPGQAEAEGTLRRTLVLAQRTADAAIAEANADAARVTSEANADAARTTSEAKAEAARVLGEANERATRLLADAESQASLIRTETEAEVRRVAEESRGPLMNEIRELERVRGFLHDDIDLLERHLAVQRDRLRSHVADLSRLVEDPASLRTEPVPATSGVDASSVLASRSFTVPAASAPNVVSHSTPEAPVWADDLDDELADDDLDYDAAFDDDGGPLDLEPEAAIDEETAHGAAPSGRALHDEIATDAAAVAPMELSGPSTAPVQAVRDAASDQGDQFLDQLRRAVDDDSADEGAMSEFFAENVDESVRSRFGRRR